MEAGTSLPRGYEQPNPDPSACRVVSPDRERVPTQTFEWIPHGDVTARRRARAHITRGFRRQKKEQAQSRQTSGKVGADASSASSLSEKKPLEPRVFRDSTSAGLESKGSSALVLGMTLGSGRADPFAAFPVKLSPHAHALLEHFFFGVTPMSYRMDGRADFQPVKKLSFNVALIDPSAFHVILSAAANDIAILRGQREPEDAIKHRAMALGLVNKHLVEWQSNSSTDHLAGVALLAGNELLFGTPQTFNTHMSGMESMLKLQGGIESLRESKPHLYSLISWFDYSGSCNLLSKRRFAPPNPNTPLLYTDPYGCPEKILQGLPLGYDLHKEITSMCQGLLIVTHGFRSKNANSTEKKASSNFVNRMDSELYRWTLTPTQEGNRSRRQYIVQTLPILALIYTVLISGYEGLETEVFLYRFENLFIRRLSLFGNPIALIFRLSLLEEELTSDVFMSALSDFVDVCYTLEWEDWRDAKTTLIDFFVYDSACHGQLQELWKQRMQTISP